MRRRRRAEIFALPNVASPDAWIQEPRPTKSCNSLNSFYYSWNVAA
jgi:hypothetical protein